MPGFNPNLGKNVVQSLKENNLLKNLKIQGWKTVDKINDADYFIKGLVAKGVDSVTPFAKGVEIMPDGSVVRSGTNYSGKFQEAHDASKASIQSRISNLESGGVKGTGSRSKTASEVNLNNIDDFINGTKNFDDVLDDYARHYIEVIDIKNWSWANNIKGGNKLTSNKRKMIKQRAGRTRSYPES